MDLKAFDFHLPEELIAQRPLPERDSSRLMLLDRKERSLEHRSFKDLPGLLMPGDLLVLNNTRVIPTRLTGSKPTGGRVELLLVERVALPDEWRCMARPVKGLRRGQRLSFGAAEATVTEILEDGFVAASFTGLDLWKSGRIPLPPYIRREADEEDGVRYQTVFAGVDGAVAAPTAGLHFTEGTIAALEARGVGIEYLTLHTGPGTFLPVRTEKVEEHRMLAERYSIGADVFERIRQAKAEGRRVIPVGTTSTRALEAAAAFGLDSPALEGATSLFIYPGYRFRVADGLLTNFHLPESTLIMLVAAFAGREFVLEAYAEAVREGYRFFSYGDAMLVI